MKLTPEQLSEARHDYMHLQNRIEMIEDEFWWELLMKFNLEDDDLDDLQEQVWD